VEQGGAMVTTGQQSGLFTGPLYTVHKALSAARLAEALEAELGILVLPVFWNASEDHDWAEVNHALVLGPEARLHRLQLHAADAHRALPMSERTLDAGVRTVLGELAHLIGREQYGDDLLTLVRGAYRPGQTVAAAFGDLLAELLAPADLLLTDAADPHLKQASVPVLQRALLETERHQRVLAERSAALQRQGYHAQVAILEGASNVFYDGAGERERLYRDGPGFIGSDSGARLAREEAVARLQGAPERFSPNVLLRPVVESAVFPTLAYVGGPGELSYFAQLNALFPEFGLEPPVAYPRASVLLMESGAERALDALGLSVTQLARPRHELAGVLARAALPAEARSALDRLSAATADGYRALIEAASAVDPTLAGALGALRNRSLSAVGEAERKILREVKRREEAALDRLDRVRNQLRPEGEPQERVLNVLPFLARHGVQLVEELRRAIPLPWGAPVG
jgi:bacillithiol biosynthesis cysteine-adding enzyme BshC